MVPLTELTAKLFSEAVRDCKNRDGLLFTSARTGRLKPLHGSSVTTACERMCTDLEISKISPHDLRRTMNTGMAKLGVAREIRERVLNQISGARKSVNEAHYNVYDYLDEKRTALGL